MVIGIQIPEIGAELDLMKVCFVQETIYPPDEVIPGSVPTKGLEINFVGGSALFVPGWSIATWNEARKKVAFQIQLAQKGGMLPS